MNHRRSLRIAIVYDRVFPASYGGAERWFRLLAESLAADGHRVTYLTMNHWPRDAEPRIPGVEIIPLQTAQTIYANSRRYIGPVIRFGAAIASYLARHGSSFDVVHSTATAPAAAHAVVTLARRLGYVAVLDWWEVWGTCGWRSYLGPAGGELAANLERRLARSAHVPVVYSQLHGSRLEAMRGVNDALRLSGVVPRLPLPDHAAPAQPYVLLANRLIPEKQTALILPALLVARRRLPSLRAVIVGSGPHEPGFRTRIAQLGLGEAVSVQRDLADEDLAVLMQNALCLALLSRREGYGLVALEAMRYGTPALILDHPDSAASERIAHGENGALVQSLDPEELASAILALHAAGNTLRERTLAWRRHHDAVLTINQSLPHLISRYQLSATGRRTGGWRNARP